MTLPLTLQMEIDLSAAAHKREVAEGFAKARAELLPERVPSALEKMMRDMQNAYGSREHSLQMALAQQQCSGRVFQNGLMGWPGSAAHSLGAGIWL